MAQLRRAPSVGFRQHPQAAIDNTRKQLLQCRFTRKQLLRCRFAIACCRAAHIVRGKHKSSSASWQLLNQHHRQHHYYYYYYYYYYY
jgi:hypothetical protein